MNSETYDNDVLVESVVDNGDGTGVRTVFDFEGTQIAVEQLTGLPVGLDEPNSPEGRVTKAIFDEIAGRIQVASTVQEMRTAILDGLAAALNGFEG